MRKFFLILKYLLPYWHKALLSLLCNLLVALFSVISFTMVIPFLGLLFSAQAFVSEKMAFSLSAESIQHNFNYYLGQIVATEGQVKALLFIILIVLSFTILKNVFLYIGKSIIIDVRTNVVKDIRNELMNKILDFDLSYFSDQRRGDIISKIILDVKEVEMSVISSLEMIFKDPVLIAVYLYVLFFISSKLTLIVIIVFPIAALIIGKLSKNLRKGTFRGQERIGALMGMIEEALAGIKIIKAFNAEKLIEKRFREQNQYFSGLFSKVWRKRTLINPIVDIIATISILIIMWFGGRMVLLQQEITSQVFIGYLAVFTQVIAPSRSLSNGYINIIKGMASFDRIRTILHHKYKIKDNKEAENIINFKNQIEFKDVVFTYENDQKPVLENISFTIRRGQTVAIAGKSGSGKSTIVDLLPRFFDPVSGDILIDGKSIKTYTIHSIRNLFAYINQEPILFNDTLYNNILYGKPNANREEIENAARNAFAYDFIFKKENGFDFILGEDGGKISIGEKQRISIARAFLKNAPVIILDEATSALDYKSERHVRKALNNLKQDKTIIVITHRLSTIQTADKILVVKDGKIVEQGNHDELIKLEGHYKSMLGEDFI